MTESELLEEASFAWDDGRTSEALQLMKFAVSSDPTLSEVRLALAERYRQMGHPDQAGRWGIVFDGWTTAVERDRLARLLASSRVSDDRTAQFLALPDNALPDRIRDLLREPTKKYRTRFNAQPETAIGSRLEIPAFWLWCAFALTGFGGVHITFFLVLYGSARKIGSASEVSALSTAFTCIVLLTLALGFSAAAAAANKSYRLAGALALASAGAGVLMAQLLASDWLVG